MPNLITKSAVRRHALDYAAQTRRMSDGTPRFKRVSKEFLLQVETCARECIERQIRSLPNAGRTLTQGYLGNNV